MLRINDSDDGMFGSLASNKPRNVPSPVGYEFPDALEEVRIVLLDPFVLDGTFEIEHVMRIFSSSARFCTAVLYR